MKATAEPISSNATQNKLLVTIFLKIAVRSVAQIKVKQVFEAATSKTPCQK